MFKGVLRKQVYFLHSLGPNALVNFLSDLAAMVEDDVKIRVLLAAYRGLAAGRIETGD